VRLSDVDDPRGAPWPRSRLADRFTRGPAAGTDTDAGVDEARLDTLDALALRGVVRVEFDARWRGADEPEITSHVFTRQYPRPTASTVILSATQHRANQIYDEPIHTKFGAHKPCRNVHLLASLAAMYQRRKRIHRVIIS